MTKTYGRDWRMVSPFLIVVVVVVVFIIELLEAAHKEATAQFGAKQVALMRRIN
jgi:hypothetical protein